MERYKMKALHELSQYEEEIKNNVKREIQSKQAKKRNRLPLYISGFAALIACILLILHLPTNNEDITAIQEPTFSLTNLSLEPFNARESTGLVLGLFYNGDQQAKLMNVEIVDPNGTPVTYEEHFIATTFSMTTNETDIQVTDNYSGANITTTDQNKLMPNSENRIILNVLLSENYEPIPNLKIKFTYETNSRTNEYLYDWDTLKALAVNAFDPNQVLAQVNASESEIATYKELLTSTSVEALKGASPITVARMYWIATAEGNLELEYRLYDKSDENAIPWSYEDHLSFSPFDYTSPNMAIQYANDLADGTFEQVDVNSGYIKFHSKNRGEMSGFNMRLSEDGIWLVSFMPLQ